MAGHFQPVKTTALTLIGLCVWLAATAVVVHAQNAPPPSTTNPPAQGDPSAQGKKNPAPGIGRGDIEIREKLETLSQLTPQQLDIELQKWPRYQQMDLGERAKLLQRIQEYKDRRHRQAESKARDLGVKMTPEQFATFEKRFWEKRLQADRQLWQEMEPRRKALDQQINSELKQEFAAFVTAPPPAPPTTIPAPVAPPTPGAVTATASAPAK
jgi:hypothetical protein